MSEAMPDPGLHPDPGLQPERTALSWRRTALSIVVGTLVVARIVLEVRGPGWVIPLGICLGAALVMAALSHRRYLVQRGMMAAGGPTTGAGMLVLCAGSVSSLATTVLCAVLLPV